MDGEPFEEFAEEYDSWFERNRWAYISELSALGKAVPDGRGLEIGVGTGRFARPFSISIGLDPSLPMLRVAKERGLIAVHGKAESLPFREGAFDFSLLVTVLCFVEDPFKVLKEARRVVHRGGHLLVGILDRDSPWGRKYEASAKRSRFYRKARFLSTTEVENLLEKVGCTVEGSFQTIFSDPGDLTAPEPVLKGHGKGLFVIVSAKV
jgi:ubiquinone/menaquinone biosynthesis C-methylase UbiE